MRPNWRRAGPLSACERPTRRCAPPARVPATRRQPPSRPARASSVCSAKAPAATPAPSRWTKPSPAPRVSVRRPSPRWAPPRQPPPREPSMTAWPYASPPPAEADRNARAADARAADTREARAGLAARLEAGRERLAEFAAALTDATRLSPEDLGGKLAEEAVAIPGEAGGMETHLAALERDRDSIGPVNLRAEEEASDLGARLQTLRSERADLNGALTRLRQGIAELNAEGRERLLAAFDVIDGHFRPLFTTLFEGGQAELRLVENDDPLEACLVIFACPPGKRLSVMSLMSRGEQALTATALIFAVFLANPAPICVLDEVDAPLDDANVERFCNLLNEMRARAPTRFVAITHNPLTMSRMDRLYGVTMPERGISQLVSVDLRQAEALAAQ